ncbi:MAG TPA: hypothetical protein VGI52_02420, partial [Solirubrobacteraceae bacterium]
MASSSKPRTSIAILLGAALALGTGGGCASAFAKPVARSIRIGRAPALPHGARAIAPLAAETQLRLTVALRSQDPSGLSGFAEAV